MVSDRHITRGDALDHILILFLFFNKNGQKAAAVSGHQIHPCKRR